MEAFLKVRGIPSGEGQTLSSKEETSLHLDIICVHNLDIKTIFTTEVSSDIWRLHLLKEMLHLERILLVKQENNLLL